MTTRRIQQALAACALAIGILMLPVARADWPGPPDVSQYTSCTPKLVQYLAFIPLRAQVALSDLGYPITPTLIPYKELQGRGWRCVLSDGGVDYYPPRLARLAHYFRPDLTKDLGACSNPALCDAGTPVDSSGTDLLAEAPFSCACAVTATCLSLPSNTPAPQGVTLAPGTFSGAGCRRKPCGELWVSADLPDGGTYSATSWPPICPQP